MDYGGLKLREIGYHKKYLVIAAVILILLLIYYILGNYFTKSPSLQVTAWMDNSSYSYLVNNNSACPSGGSVFMTVNAYVKYSNGTNMTSGSVERIVYFENGTVFSVSRPLSYGRNSLWERTGLFLCTPKGKYYLKITASDGMLNASVITPKVTVG